VPLASVIALLTLAPRPQLFEVSAGSALTTPVADIGRYDDDVEVVPHASAFFLAEYFVAPEFRVAAAYDLPTSTAQRVVGGEKQERVVPSRAFVGLVAAPFSFGILDKSVLELQGGVFLGVEMDDDPRVLPMAFGRLHASQDALTGVGVYLGIRYVGGSHDLAAVYGVGYRF
jgi:hypothetical protein